jgi:cytochrome c553
MRLRVGVFGCFLLIGLASAVECRAADYPGRQKAQQVCAVCHGVDGIAKNPDAPNLAGDSQNYIEKQLKAFRSGERKQEQMSIIAQGLQDQDIRDVAKWYSSIKIKVELPQ